MCPSCGKSAGGGAPAKTAAAAPPAQKSGSALKVILLVLGGLLLLFVVVIAVVVGGAYYVAKQTHVETTSGGAKVETPFGTVETNNEDSAKIAEKMGVEVYPGAKALPGGASVKLGGMSTASVLFESDDPPEKVADFYRKQFPNANVTSHSDDGGTHIALMIGKNEKWTTITIEGHEGGSKIVIASVNGGAK
ncbi:MAG TPA: hypothetical protein VGQ94_06230 [Terriglobales bacterium]|nr:hypothetical protein [Terriglobales bacterium]